MNRLYRTAPSALASLLLAGLVGACSDNDRLGDSLPGPDAGGDDTAGDTAVPEDTDLTPDTAPDAAPDVADEPDADPADTTADAGEDAGEDTDPGDAAQDTTPIDPLPTTWRVVHGDELPQAVQLAVDDVADYLRRMGRTVTVETVEGAVPCPTDGTGTIVFAEQGVGRRLLRANNSVEQEFRVDEQRCEGDGRLVELEGNGLLGRQYAAYEFLHALGVRFFHPEQEYVPGTPAWPDDPLALRIRPAFRYRSVSLHLTHPLELGDAFRLDKPEYHEEGRRYIDWLVKNGASYGHTGVGSGEYANWGRMRGMPRSTGFSLHSAQQGGIGIIDPDDPRTEEEQIAAAIDARMGGPGATDYPEFFSFTFNPSEFTELPDLDIVRQITFIANHIGQHYPNTILLTINHGTAGRPTENYRVRFYDLPKFAPPNLGVQVHTLMFYDLFRPAPVYGNTDFNYLYDFMVEEYQDRRIWHFPEAAWWLTFDNPVPLYLPITIEARDRDIQNIAFMLAGKLDGHRTFGSGHEWGYWQNEYCSFRLSMNLAYRYTDCVADIVSPLGPAAGTARDVLLELIQLQERDFIYGDILGYLVGTDPETETAASIGIHFHPLPPSPAEILQWDLEQTADWRRRIEPGLLRMAADHERLGARLDAVAASVPEDGLPWYREIRDGVAINGIRARHSAEVYGAVVRLRESQLRFDAELETTARAMLADAIETTDEAIEVIRRREQDYRYLPIERSIAGGPEGRDDDNWTIYRFRYLNRTHHAYYYTRIDRMAEAAFDGARDAVSIDDVILADDQPLHVLVTDPSLDDIVVDVGEGTPFEGENDITWSYTTTGAFDVRVTADRDGTPFESVTSVASVDAEWYTAFSGRIASPPGVDLIEGIMPGVVVGRIDADRWAIGFDVAGQGNIQPGLWTEVGGSEVDGVILTTPERFVVPVVNRSARQIMTSIIVQQGVASLDTTTGTLILRGDLSTSAVIDAVVAVGGFDQRGARATVASLLGYTADTLPSSVPFEARYTIVEH